ncbi:MAG TPA: hydantoinase B/oxoprolinase family protein, partial [Acetobacteraceae bacterium]|nr:hydantoinase B/oxoprolinase family protein [Acetobacteraceae bacterium]
LEMDFSGSDPQVRYALNFTTSERPHPFLCMPVVNWIQTVEPTTPRTGGIIRPIRTRAPEGTFMHATFPAAMGNRWVAVMRVYDAILGCLNQAVPGGIAAAGAGQAGIISVSAVDERTGRRHVSVVEPFIGGSGGRNGADGIDGIDQPVAFLRSAPVETVEVETDLLVRRLCYEPGSAAPGRHRGGLGIRIELENRGLPATMTVRGQDRFRLQPWGVAGGASGRSGRTTLECDGTGERDIGRIDVLELPQGGVVRMLTPCGGGFADPFTRDKALVIAELRDGLLTRQQASEQYGVVANAEGDLDEAATQALRTGRRPAPPRFTFGPTREALEARWPPAVRAALATAVMVAPPQVRSFWMDSIIAELEAACGPVTQAQVEAAVRRRLEAMAPRG